MMTVGDVEIWNAGKGCDQRIVGWQAPDRMMKIVVRDKVIKRRIVSQSLSDERVDLFLGPISQKHRPCLGPQHQDLARAIVFLVAARALVLANYVLIVFIH